MQSPETERKKTPTEIAARLALTAGLVAVGIYGVGAVSLGLGIMLTTVVNKAMSHYNILGWNNDSKKMAHYRTAVAARWAVAEKNGVAYTTFLEQEKELVKRLARATAWQSRRKLVFRSSLLALTLGVTGVRPGLLSDASTLIDGIVPGWGDFATYGFHWAQKISHLVTSTVVATAVEAGHELGIKVAYADSIEFPNPDREHPNRLPLFVDPDSPSARSRSIRIIENHIAWAREVLAKYKAVMSMNHDMFAPGKAREMEAGIKALQKMESLLESGAPLSELRNNDTLISFRNTAELFYEAAYQINTIPPYGGFMLDGTPRPLSELFNVDFKHKGFDRLPAEMGRALYEFYFDLGSILRGDYGWTITEGWKPDGKHLTSQHESHDHHIGRAVDMRPTGPRGVYDTEYARAKMRDPQFVYRVLVLQINNPYYSILFEPKDLDPTGAERAQIKEWLTWGTFWGGQGMTPAQAEAFLDAHYGNRTFTDGAHFHVAAKAPLLGPVSLKPREVA